MAAFFADPTQFGAQFNGDDVTKPLNAAIRSLDPIKGGTVSCPFGTGRLSGPIVIDRPTVLAGAGGARFPGAPGDEWSGTRLLVPAGTTGIKIAPTGGTSAVRHLFLAAEGRAAGRADGTIAPPSGPPFPAPVLRVSDRHQFTASQIIRVAGAGMTQRVDALRAATTAGSNVITVLGRPRRAILAKSRLLFHGATWDWEIEVEDGQVGQRIDVPGAGLAPQTFVQRRLCDLDGGRTLYTMSAPATVSVADAPLILFEDHFAEVQAVGADPADTTGTRGVLTLDTHARSAVVDAPVLHADPGVLLQGSAALEHVQVRGFQGPGILIAADHDNHPASNANGFALTRCTALENLYGVYAVGGDANAGVGLGLDVAGNRSFGLADASSLGSTWIGCHAQGGLGYKTVDFRARGTFVGCYTEGGTSNLFGPAALVTGGTMEEPVASYADAMPSATTVANYTRGDVLLNRHPEELGVPGARYVVLGWSCVSSGHPGTWVDLRALTGN